MTVVKYTRTAALLLGLASALAPLAAAAQVGGTPHVDTTSFRPLDLPPANEFRSASGAPGRAYWQQRADYEIQATLDTTSQSLSGTEVIHYHNQSPDTLRFVWLTAEQNLYRAGNLGAALNPAETRFGARAFQGGLDVSSARVAGTEVKPYVWDTMMRIDLPRPLAPGQSVDLAFAWSFKVPTHGSDRMGREGSLYEMAQWFPRMAVYDDVSGWNTLPYLGQGEFYREFGNYDVALTVPAGYIVGATGTLQNAAEVLTPAQRDRLARAATSTTQLSIISAQEAGTAAARPRTTGTLTWRFRAENVHDFAWAASPTFVWDSESSNGVQCHSLYQRGDAGWRNAADATCFSIREFSKWYPYPWPQATSVAGPVGGMEYPMFVMVGSEGSEQDVFGTLAHEHGHEWFPMIVSSNERLYAWMDEGFNTFVDAAPNALRFPGARTDYSPAVDRADYASLVVAGKEEPIMTPADRIGPQALSILAYSKPSIVLGMLRDAVIGPEAFDAAFKEYIRRWAFKHPTPADFFRTMENVSGRDLDWYWREWLYSTDVLDLAITNVAQQRTTAGANRVQVDLTRNTKAIMPVTLRLTLANGQNTDVNLPVEIWYGGPSYSYVTELPAQVVGAVLDPNRTLVDVNANNNRWGNPK
jgi:hypothetical protein